MPLVPSLDASRPALSSLDAVSPFSPRSSTVGHRSPLTPLLDAAHSPDGRRSPLAQSPLTSLAQPPPMSLAFSPFMPYRGGTNFGRTAGGPFIATSYDYNAPLDEYGLLTEPKWSHLRDLHKAIKQSECALVFADPAVQSLGSNQEAHVFKAGSGYATSWQTTAQSILSESILEMGNMTCCLGPSAFF